VLSIGRFADSTGLTVRALRHYDEIGPLAPARVEPATGYRFYDPAQIEDAVTIRRLRALELSLDEIRSLLDADPGALRDRLAAHRDRVAGEASDKQMLAIELRALLVGGGERIAIEVSNEPELRLAGAIRHLKLVDPEGVSGLLQAVRDALAERGVSPTGPPTALFRSGDGAGRHLVEAGFPVGQGFGGDDGVQVNVYEASRAATYRHHGPYGAELDVAAQRFIATVLGQGLTVTQAIRIEFLGLGHDARLVWPFG
jgi:DNA-binding transcriptional MerR regulator